MSTASFDRYHHNRISSIPYRNVDDSNGDINTTQNHLVFNLPTEISSIDPFIDITSSSSVVLFKEPNFYDTLNDQDLFRMVYNNSFPRSEGIFSFSQGLQQNTLWNGSMQDQGIISGSHDPCLDKIVFESQSLDPPLKESIKSTIRNTIGKYQDQTLFKINQKQHKIMKLKGSKPSKKSNTIKGQWTSDEDTKLIDWVKQNGTKKWLDIAKILGGRAGKQCRERWHYSLCPDIKKDAWSEEEYQILIETHKVIGKQWTKIAQKLPGRNDTMIKNLWNTTERRIQTKRNKKQDESNIFSPRNSLENYIWSITEYTNHPKTTTLVATSANADLPISNEVNDDGDDGDIETQIVTPLTDESTTLVYVPTQASESTSYTPWTDNITEHYKLIDDIWMAMEDDGLVF